MHATKVAPVDKQGPAPAEAKVGTAPDCTQIRNRGTGATPRSPKARQDSRAQAHKVVTGHFVPQRESGGERRTTGPTGGSALSVHSFLRASEKSGHLQKTIKAYPRRELRGPVHPTTRENGHVRASGSPRAAVGECGWLSTGCTMCAAGGRRSGAPRQGPRCTSGLARRG